MALFQKEKLGRFFLYILGGLFLLIFCRSLYRQRAQSQGEEINVFLRYPSGKKEQKMPEVVEWLVNWTQSHKIPIFAIEPGILGKMIDHPQKSETNGKTISFGLFGNQENLLEVANLQAAVDKLSGFKYLKTRQPLPRTEHSRNPVERNTHHLIYKDSIMIDIAIFWQVREFLWTGAINVSLDERLPHSVKDLMFGGYERAYDLFSTKFSYYGGLHFRTPKCIKGFLWQLEASRFMPCDFEQQENFYTTFPEQKKQTDGENLLQDYITINNRLIKLRKRSWLAGGSLLGWFRQCGIINETMNLDLGVWAKEQHTTDLTEIMRIDHKAISVIMRILKLGKMKAAPLKVNILLVYEEKNSTRIGSLEHSHTDKLKYRYPLIPELCSCELYGYRFNIPCNVKDFVEAAFGEEWQTPKEK